MRGGGGVAMLATCFSYRVCVVGVRDEYVRCLVATYLFDREVGGPGRGGLSRTERRFTGEFNGVLDARSAACRPGAVPGRVLRGCEDWLLSKSRSKVDTVWQGNTESRRLWVDTCIYLAWRALEGPPPDYCMARCRSVLSHSIWFSSVPDAYA